MPIVTSLAGEQMEITFDLFTLKQQLQIATGREFSFSEIAREANLHRNTVERIALNRTDRVDLETLAKLIFFFRRYGVTVTAGELFKVKDLPTPIKTETGD